MSFPRILSFLVCLVNVTDSSRSRRLYANVDWSLPQYYVPSTAVAVGTKLYYFSRGPDALFFEEYDTVADSWRALTPYSWLTDTQGWDVPMRYETIRLATVGALIYVYGRGQFGTWLSSCDPVSEVWTAQPSFAFLQDTAGFTTQPYYQTVRLISIGTSLYLLGRNSAGFLMAAFDTASQTWSLLPSPGQFTADATWSQYMYYSTFRVAVEGSTLWLYGRGPSGINLMSYSAGTWSALHTYVYFQDAGSWGNPQFYETTSLNVFNSIVYMSARGIANIYTIRYNPSTNVFTSAASLPMYTDANGWNVPQYYFTIRITACNSQLYVAGRGSGAVYMATYAPDAWTVQGYAASFMSDADGWSAANSYKSQQQLCIGSSVYYVGRLRAQVSVSRFTTSTWAAPNFSYAPCANTCKACTGDTVFSCTTCFAGNTLTGPSPAACCPPHMYRDAGTLLCTDCDAHCVQCNGVGANSCISCPANAVLAGTTCNCVSGWYWDASVVCSQCPSPCSLCTAADHCQACLANAVLVGNMCVCAKGFFVTASSCSPCDTSCAACADAGSSMCTECHAGAAILNLPAAPCACTQGFFTTGPGVCQPCDPSCFSCDGPTATSCLSCHAGAALSSSRACQCISGFYAVGSLCSPCDVTCRRCTGPLASDCVDCWSDAVLLTNSTCVCAAGFYSASTAAACVPCPSLCATCSSSLSCATCVGNAQLDSTAICRCSLGYFEVGGKCQQCAQGCGVCNSVGCSECLQGWLVLGADCVQQCPAGYESANAVCLPSPLHATLTNSPDNVPTLAFSQPVNKTLTYADISVTVSAASRRTVVSAYEVVSVTANTSYSILLGSADVPTTNSTLWVSFLTPSDWMSANGQRLNESTLSVPLHPVTRSLLPAISATATAASRGAATSIATISIISGNPVTLFGLVNQLQLITYIPLLSLSMPSQVVNTLAALNSNSLVFSPLQGVGNSTAAASHPPAFAQVYGFQTTLFLSNSSFIVISGLSVALSYVCVALLARVKVVPVLAVYCERLKAKYRWDYPLQWWLSAFMDVGVNCLLQFATISQWEWDLILLLNAAIAGLFCLAFVASPFVLIRVMLSSKEPVPRLGLLYGDLEPTVRLYFPLYLFRRLVYALTLMQLGAYPSLQVLLSTAIALVSLSYLLIYRPFRRRVAFLSPLIAELSASGVLLLICPYTLLDADSTTGVYLGQGAIYLVYAGMAACMAVAVYQVFEVGRGVIRTFKRIAAELKAEKANFKTNFARRSKNQPK